MDLVLEFYGPANVNYGVLDGNMTMLNISHDLIPKTSVGLGCSSMQPEVIVSGINTITLKRKSIAMGHVLHFGC